MADVKISNLPASTVPLAGTEVLPVVQSGSTKQVSIANLTAGRPVEASSVTATNLKTSPTAANLDVSGTSINASGTDNNININLVSKGTGQVVVNSGAVATPTIAPTGDLNTGIFFPAADNTAFAQGGAESVRIINDGSVGIGTSSPINKLQVSTASAGVVADSLMLQNGTANAVAGQGVRINLSGVSQGISNLRFAYIESSSPTGQNEHSLSFGTNNVGSAPVERLYIAPSGITTMSAYGAGAATFSASGVISSVSDETWKVKDSAPVNPDVMLQKLNPGYWFYNEEKAPIFGKDRQLGFYAQNVNAAIGPEAAPAPEEGKPWGYYDRSVLAVTVMSLKNALNSIQKQQELIDSLTARLNVLEGK